MIEALMKSTIVKNDLLKRGDYVVIGLSGGPDSVCLFSVLLALRDELALHIKAVHVNHMLRPVDADKDQEYVETICREKGIACDVVVCDCAKVAKAQGITDEEAGRNIRYEAFYKAAKEWLDMGIPAEKIKIAVAQNKNDQAETLLMRIIRGTGTNGLSGIEYKRVGQYGTSVIRPLLDVERTAIEDYCREKNLTPRIDHTNAKPLYTRNKVRLELIPYIAERFNENITDALARLAENAREDNLYLREAAETAYQLLVTESEAWPNVERMVALDRNKLKRLPPAVRHRVIFRAFREIGLIQDIASAHLKMIDNIVMGKSASASVNLPERYGMSVSYEKAFAYLKGEETALTGEVPLRLTLTVLTAEAYRAAEISGARYTAALDYGRIRAAGGMASQIEMRTRRAGDYFTPRGMKTGKKKMQDYFVDRKIPKEHRASCRLAVLGKEVLCVFAPFFGAGCEISEKYKLTDDTKEVLLLEIGDKL